MQIYEYLLSFVMLGSATPPVVKPTYEYLFIVVLFFIAFGFVAFNFVVNALIGVKPKPNPIKQEPFECGSPPFHSSSDRTFSVKYATVAILFVMFDLEAVLLYPWAITARSLGWGAVLEGILFIAILLFGLIYVWRKGLLNWI